MGTRDKSPEAFRTISEVADDLDLPQHVLRFWETRFAQIRPMKRGGGRRYYRPEDVELLRGIRQLLYEDGYTIKGVQRILKQRGPRHVAEASRPPAPSEWQGASPSENLEAQPGFADAEQTAPDHGSVTSPDHSSASSPDDDSATSPEHFDPPDDEQAVAGAGPRLSQEAVRKLRSVLFELRECRRVLDEALLASSRGQSTRS